MAMDTVVEEVADNIGDLAEATRRINTNSVSFYVGGMFVGFAIGFYWGYKFNKEKIRADAFRQSEEEIDKIREHYQKKVVAATEKPSPSEIIEERGYFIKPDAEPERPLKPSVPIHPPLVTVPPPVVIYEGGKDKDRDWDYPKELQNRSPGEPYIIHQDEFKQNSSGFRQVIYTYFAADDTLVDELSRPLPHADIIVGVNNLRFGHGSDDIDVVFVRNEEREVEMEICRSPKSYEEEVLGLESDLSDDDDDDST